MHYDYDVLIVGGGLAGNCLALALKDSGLRYAIVEANSREDLYRHPAGDRALALSAGTVEMLNALNVWQGVKKQAESIKHIHVSDQGHFGKTRLSAEKQGVDALGYVIVAREIENELAQHVEELGIESFSPARVAGLFPGQDGINVNIKKQEQSINLTVKLVVGADGGQSTVRRLLDIAQQQTDYGQTAIVTTVKTSVAHQQVAYERFTSSGPLALLPVSANECSVVWTRTHEQAEQLMAISEQDFLVELQACFGFMLGELQLTAARRAFPLQLIQAESMIANRTLMIGNAVHQLHPVAGQGFNLAMRDVVQLAEMLIALNQTGKDVGLFEGLKQFADHRKKDHLRTIQFTGSLVKLFSNDLIPVAVARNIGLSVLDIFPVAKSILSGHAMGLAERLPRIGIRR